MIIQPSAQKDKKRKNRKEWSLNAIASARERATDSTRLIFVYDALNSSVGSGRQEEDTGEDNDDI